MAGSKPSKSRPIAFVDLEAQQRRLRSKIDRAIAGVLDHGKYTMGPEVSRFEQELADLCGAKHAISCSSGTDALLMVLMAQGIGPGDGVLCPAFTFTATPETIALLGATAVFVDVQEATYNVDPDRLEDALAVALDRGLKLRAIVPVDLFGRPADYHAILSFAQKHDLFVLCDGAQSFGASINGTCVGRFGEATAISFFPAKPLGCYGDGGAVLTDDDTLADAVRSIRLHGKGSAKYDIVRVGINGRLDTIQAAVLLQKLSIFADEIKRRNAIALRYSRGLKDHVGVPEIENDDPFAWAQYTIRVPANRRDAIAAHLREAGIPTAVYYPRPVHKQPAYKDHLKPPSGLSVSERLANEVLSLPMHPYLDDEQVDRVVAGVISAVSVGC